MAAMNREQIVQYIKNLEQKVKQYQLILKKRDQEILDLRNQLDEIVANGSPVAAETIQELVTPEPEKKQSIVTPAIKPKVKPLEERAPSFVKKAAPGIDEKVKEAIRAKKEEALPPPIEEPPLPAAGEMAAETPEEEGPVIEAAQVPQPPKPVIHFQAGAFLSAVLDGEEEADEIKSLLHSLESCEKDQRRNILLSLTSVFWRLVASMAKRQASENLIWEKRLAMRYGMLDEKLMADRMDVWNQLYLDKSKPGDTGMYFIDEWFDEIARGRMKYSTIDEYSLDGVKPDPKATGALALKYEIINVPQMQRMCVGARANTIAILTQEYCAPSRDNPVINRAWLKEALKFVVSCDYLMFRKKYKGDDVDLQPLFIICPGYGQRSGCWEPWSPGMKGRSGARICICAFPPKSSIRALITGISDYRWEYAKTDAMHYWLSEGLTGKWIALFSTKEQRQDLKAVFMDNYYHWIANEARRIPKLDKRFREFFWHNTPFSDEIKQTLKGGGMFGRLIELEEAKKKREEEERIEIERITAEREARKAARKAKLEGGGS